MAGHHAAYPPEFRRLRRDGGMRTSTLTCPPNRRHVAVALLLPFALIAFGCGPGSGGAAADGYLIGAGDARLYYQVLGDAPDTVVVVHGGPGAGIASIRPAVEPLAEHVTLILYDQRGGGRSELPADTSLLHARYHVADLEAVRRHFGLERMKVLAHSFGAVIVARYAELYPDRLERMVFHGATGPRWEDAVRVARASPPPVDSALAARSGELLGALLRGEAEDPVTTCEEWEAVGLEMAELRGEAVTWKGTSCGMPAEALAYYFRNTAQHSPRTFGRWDFTIGLESVAAPLLVVYGDEDTLGLRGQRAWAAAVPNGRLLIVRGAGKGGLMARPDMVVPAVARFLAGAWPEGADAASFHQP